MKKKPTLYSFSQNLLGQYSKVLDQICYILPQREQCPSLIEMELRTNNVAKWGRENEYIVLHSESVTFLPIKNVIIKNRVNQEFGMHMMQGTGA